MSRTGTRAFELDALRGLAILMMILHHLIFDLRYILGLDVFAFQEQAWFQYLLRPFFVAVFLIVSGICCSFSRSNARRGLRMTAAAAVLTVATVAMTLVTDDSYAIYFNVIHVIATGTLLYALLERRDRKAEEKKQRSLRLGVSLLIATTLLFLGGIMSRFDTLASDWLLPIGLPTHETAVAMGDYMPLIPWLGFFFAGAVLGLVYYRDRQTLFPHAPTGLVRGLRPLCFVGRNALLFYLLHQPILLGILTLLRKSGII